VEPQFGDYQRSSAIVASGLTWRMADTPRVRVGTVDDLDLVEPLRAGAPGNADARSMSRGYRMAWLYLSSFEGRH
jgi:hypothetical protein